MYYIYLYVQILCYLSSQESNYLFIYICIIIILTQRAKRAEYLLCSIYIPEERGTLVTSELQCPSVSDDHKSICCILYIGRARRPSGSGASIVFIYNMSASGSERIYIVLQELDRLIRIDEYLVYRNIVYRIILQQYIVNTVQILIYSKKENSGLKIRGLRPRHFKNFPPGDIYIIYIV